MKTFEKKEMPLLKDYILLNKFGLSVMGVWPLPHGVSKWRQALQYIHITMIYGLLFALLIPQLLDLYVYRGNIQANSENLCTSLTTFTVLVKFSNLIAMRCSFKVALREMEENWNCTMRITVPRIHRDLLLRAAVTSRTFTRRYCVTMYVTATMYFILPLITNIESSTKRARKYPFCAWYHYDETSDSIYVILYLSQVVIGLSCGTGNYSMDSLFLVMVYHICAQLRILQSELKMLGISETRSDSLVLKKMKNIVKNHERHIKNAVNLKAVFDGASLQQLFVSSVIICVIGFKLIVSLDASKFESVIYVTYMHLVIFQIYLYCSPGEDLLNESIGVGRAAYECPWMDLPSSVKRCLLVTMMRSQRPLSITAGNFYVMSMENFSKILKTSLSYLSVLRAMYDQTTYRKS